MERKCPKCEGWSLKDDWKDDYEFPCDVCGSSLVTKCPLCGESSDILFMNDKKWERR